MVESPPPIALAPDHIFIRQLNAIFQAQAREIISRLTLQQIVDGHKVSVGHWDSTMVESLRPYMLAHWMQGREAGGAKVDLALRGEPTALQLAVKFADFQIRKTPRYHQIRKQTSGIGVDWGMVNPHVIEAVDRATLQFCRATNDTATGDLNVALAKLRRELKEGLSQGEALHTLSVRVRNIFADPARAFRIAATECFPGETLITGANITSIYRRWYCGPMIQVVTENGHKLTGTVNHPVLTDRGWIALSDLDESDSLVCDFDNVKNSGTGVSGYVDIETPPASLSDIFDSFSTIGVRSRASGAKPDFHGDGRDGDVDVFGTEGVLRIGRLATAKQLIENVILSPSYFGSVGFFGDGCGLGAGDDVGNVGNSRNFFRVSKSNSRLAKFLGKSATAEIVLAPQLGQGFSKQVLLGDFFEGNILELFLPEVSAFSSEVSCVKKGATNASVFAHVTDGCGMAVVSSRNHDGALPGNVKFDNIRSLLRIEEWSGHVYNLSCEDGYYAANSLYAKNCSRATYAGEMQSATESGVISMSRWTCSAAACSRCLELDLEERELGEPFIVLPGGGHYSVILHPPLHPSCFCATVYVLSPSRQIRHGPPPPQHQQIVIHPGNLAGEHPANPWDNLGDKAEQLAIDLAKDKSAHEKADAVKAMTTPHEKEAKELKREVTKSSLRLLVEHGTLENLMTDAWRGNVPQSEITAANLRYSESCAEHKRLAAQAKEAQDRHVKAQAKEVAKIMAAPKPVAVKPEYAGHRVPDEVRSRIDEACEYLAEILGQSGRGENAIRVPFHVIPSHEEQRAFCRKGEVWLTKDSDVGTILHELGHSIETLFPKASASLRALWHKRCDGKPTTPMQSFGTQYDASEIGCEDDFGRSFGKGTAEASYAGKRYKDGSTEILSLALESLYRKPKAIAADKELFALLTQILLGQLR